LVWVELAQFGGLRQLVLLRAARRVKIVVVASVGHVSHLHQALGFLDLLLQQLFVFEKALGHAVLRNCRLELAPRLEQRHYHHIDVAQLKLKWVTGCAVEEWRNSEVELAFQIALLVILLHLVREPLKVNDWQLAWVAVVARVQTHIQNKLLVLVVIFWELLGGKTPLELHYKF
jgi:hypothetical protein